MAVASELVLDTGDSVVAAPRVDSAKRRQILDGARAVFLADGFDGASMNDIARSAGVSKGTLYVYFASKEELFAALISDEKRAQVEQLCDPAPGKDLRATLHGFGVRLLELMLRPDSIAHLRIVLAAAAKFPSIGQAFYEAGPKFGRARLARVLDGFVAEEKLDVDDSESAAMHFVEICKAPYLLEAILGVGARPSVHEIEAHVTRAVDLFIRAYGKAGA